MTDFFEASIRLRKSDIEKSEDLRRAIKQDLELNSSAMQEIMDWNDSINKDSDVIELYNDSARYGMFAYIESYCEKHKVPYDRWSDINSSEATPAFTRYYRPGQDPESMEIIMDNMLPLIPKREVVKCLHESDARVALKELLTLYTPVPLEKL